MGATLPKRHTADRGCPKTCNTFPGLKYLNYNERLKCPDLPNMKYRKERGDRIVRHGYKYTHGPYSVNKSLLKMDIEMITRVH